MGLYRLRRNLKLATLSAVCFWWWASCSAPSEEEGINALYFGGDCYIEIANDPRLKAMLESDFSIEIWVAADQSPATTTRTIFMCGNNSGGNELGIYQPADDPSGVLVYIDDEQFGNFSIDRLDWGQGRFHYLCLTNVGGLVSFYFDGGRLESRQLPNLDLNLGSSNVLIGADYDPPGVNANVGDYWVGYIGEVRLWSRCISAEEVQFKTQHPEKLLQRYSADDLALLTGLWRFNNEQDGVLTDESGKGLVASLRGNSANFRWSTKKK